MDINPLSLIERLINEHGSAQILREHLAVIKDQFSFLEKENAVLKDKVKHFESDLQDCTKENNRLNQVIKPSQEKQGIEKLEDITEKTLQMFFNEAKELDSEYLSPVLSLHQSIVDYHIDILLNNKMITQTREGVTIMGISSPSGFSITPKGQAYIINKDKARE